MATYYYKYYYQTVRNGRTYRLNILQRDTQPDALRKIKNLVDLRFGTAGNVDIDEPIIKTELSFVLVDCPDVAYDATEKGANWQEFYTQDSTLYKVQLLENGVVRWTGYITPDSWSEELRYHGTVTIKARDCIGHLQDFDFEWDDETITLYQVITKCNSLCSINIVVGNKMNEYGLRYTDYQGTGVFKSLSNARFYKDAFEDKNWYEVLESILSSLALTLRYFDNNIFGITPVGFIRTDTFSNRVARANKTFGLINNSGSHSLAPMYKFIKERISYDFYDASERDIPKTAFKSHSGYTSPLTSAAGYNQYRELTALDVLCLRFDLDDNSYVETFVKIPESTAFTVDLSVIGGYFFKNLAYDVLPASLSFTEAAVTARVSIIWKGYDGTTVYYNNPSVWSSSSKILTYTSEASVAAAYTDYTIKGTTPSNKGKLYIRFYHASGAAGYQDRRFTAVKGVGGTYTVAGRTTKHETQTVNNELANVRLDRTCDVGQYVGAPAAGICVKNAMLAGSSTDYYSVDGLGKSGDSSVRYPNMWTWTHKQLLCFHWNTASIIEGEIYDITQNNPKFSDIWLYPFSSGLKRLHLVSGQLNVLTGRMESAVLREFWDFDALWQEPKMDCYQIYILGVESASGSDNIQLTQDSEGFVISSRLEESDYPVTVHCRIANANNWIQPRVDMSVYHSHTSLRGLTVLNMDTSNRGYADFDIQLVFSDFDDQDPEVYLQALWRNGDEGGMWWEEAPTLNGYIKLD